MYVIDSKIDTRSDEYRKNYEAMEVLLEDLKKELTTAMDDRSQKAKDRLKESGKLPAKKKLELLLDIRKNQKQNKAGNIMDSQ